MPFYYSVDYRAYPAGTNIVSFSMEEFEKSKSQIEHVAEVLLDWTKSTDQRPTEKSADQIERAGSIAGREELAIDLPSGPHAVKELQLKLDRDAAPQALRSTVVQIEFDGEQTVWCPLGELFGCGAQLSPLQDWTRKVTADGALSLRFVMPYQKTGRVTVKNVGQKAVNVKLTVTCGPWQWDDRSMYFHANWRSQYPLPTRPMSDWNFVEIQGQSKYVGDTLTVLNPTRGWYGEGDERVYVDGEKFPSHLGTGTEDYYGYAWGMADYFSSPFMSMPRRESTGKDNWRGYTTTSRIRLLDGIPAEKSLKFDMEIWHWDDCKVGYNVATFWYGRPGAHGNIAPAPELAAATLPTVLLRMPGAIECEAMRVVKSSPQLKHETQQGGLPEGSWSGDSQLFVRATKPGDYIDLLIADAIKGPRRVTLYGTKSFDYGILRFSVNGKSAGPAWDGWAAKPALSGPIELGTFEPDDGKLVLHVEVVGANPKATGPKHYFGLDAIILAVP